MKGAIRITLAEAGETYDLTASKLFGAPVIPPEWEDRFPDEAIFFGQLRLSDIADYDPEGRLPHTGYLYLFLDTEVFPYTAWAEYYDGEPCMVVDDFNEAEPRFAHLNRAFLMSFSPCDAQEAGTRLFGIPSSGDAEGELLLQFDPLAQPTGFLEQIDGYAYFFFGDHADDRIENIRFEVDYS